MARIFIIILCLIVYGSLYPWQFQATHFTASPVSLLLRSWPASFNRYVLRDTGVNVILYAPLGLFGYLLWAPSWRKARATAAVLGVALILSTAIEFVQLFEPSRYSSIFDILCNLTGATAGLVLARLYTERLKPFVAWSEREEFFHLTAGAVLLLCWIGYQTAPLFPQLSTTQLLLKLRTFGSTSSWSLVELIAGVVDWLAVTAVVEEVAGAESIRIASVALLLLLPGRLFLDTRSLTGSECAAAILAVIIWRRFLGVKQNRFLLIGWLSVAALVLRGLAPFHFTADQQFSWVPFGASLSYEQAAALVVFFKKCFLYGVAVWLLAKAGFPYLLGTIGVASLLAVIEVVQIRLPGRTPEITDPLLAVIMAVILRFTSRHTVARKPSIKTLGS